MNDSFFPANSSKLPNTCCLNLVLSLEYNRLVVAIAPWLTNGLIVWVGDKSAARTLLNGSQLPLWPIFLLTSFPPNLSTARANVNNLLMDSIGTVLFAFPASYTSPSHDTNAIPNNLGSALANSGMYEATLPPLLFLTLSNVLLIKFCILTSFILINGEKLII